jgi:predicted small metal-binding protein
MDWSAIIVGILGLMTTMFGAKEYREFKARKAKAESSNGKDNSYDATMIQLHQEMADNQKRLVIVLDKLGDHVMDVHTQTRINAEKLDTIKSDLRHGR